MITAKSRSAETSGGFWFDLLLKAGPALSSDRVTWGFIQAGLVNLQRMQKTSLDNLHHSTGKTFSYNTASASLLSTLRSL